MRKTLKVNESSVMYRKIDELVMSEMDRTQAVGALKAADRLADAYDGLKRIISRAAVLWTSAPTIKHPTLKHQLKHQ